MKKYNYSWVELENNCIQLAMQLQEKYDLVVSLNRGGLVAGVMLSHLLKIPHTPLSIALRDYPNIEHDEELARILTSHQVLFVDDINDTGETISAVKSSIESILPEIKWDEIWHNTSKFATLYSKTSSSQTVDYYINELTVDNDLWINFPWENFWEYKA